MFDALKSPGRRRDHVPLPQTREPRSERTDSARRHSRLDPRRLSKVWSRRIDPEKADPRPEPQPDTRPDPEVEQLEVEIRELRRTDGEAKRRHDELDSEILDIKKRLKNRVLQRERFEQITNELAVAQKFLSTADSLSQAEVVRAMEALNEEIFQLTSIVADKIQVKDQSHIQDTSGFRRLIPKSCLGPAFLDIITPRKLEDPLAIQIGWQAILAERCSELIRAWYTETLHRDEGLNGDMRHLYKSITSAHEQAIAGRWRSLTFGVTDEPSSDARQQLIDSVANALAAVPVLCGYISSQKAFDDLFQAFRQRIGPLLDKCLKFRKMIAEGITSTDIRPYSIHSGVEYDPEHGELEYEDEKDDIPAKTRGTVACSLALGLVCTRASQKKDKVVRIQETILKSKVILQDTLIEIIS